MIIFFSLSLSVRVLEIYCVVYQLVEKNIQKYTLRF